MRVSKGGGERYPDKAERYPDKAERYPDDFFQFPQFYRWNATPTKRNAIPMRFASKIGGAYRYLSTRTRLTTNRLTYERKSIMAASKPIRTHAEILALGHTKAQEVRAQLDQSAAATPVQMFLPGMDEAMRAMPNHISRSSLFAPVARGRKKAHAGTALVSRADARIQYWGEQLDEAQADIYMQVMYEATKHTLGEPFVVNVAAFLRAMGRKTGKWEYDWLKRSMRSLTAATLVIEAGKPDGKGGYRLGFERSFHLIEWFDYDDDAQQYMVKIDPRWQRVYGSKEFALVDWHKRMQIGQGMDMAKALQRLIATSSDATQRYALDWLKAKFEYTSPMRKFKTSLMAAVKELERLAILLSGEIERNSRNKDQLVLTR